nr:oligopeptide/dipeptide ABC transporter ATP-binding protein [uncultured Curtobacterium sp.]
MERPILEAIGLTKHFGGQAGFLQRPKPPVQAVSDVSFTVRRGETLALVGESGSGKSTLGRLLLNLLAPTAGDVIYEGRNLGNLSPAALRQVRQELQIIFQDPFASLNPRMSVADIVGEPVWLHQPLNRGQRAERVAELLRTVGLAPELAGRYPHEFSGGQRQRIGIARALIVEPKILVLDEPVSALDVSVQAGVINLLEDLKHRLGLSYLFVAHDLSVVRHIADDVAVMYLGRIVEYGEGDRVFDDPQHPYTRALLSAVPVPDPSAEAARGRILLQGDLPSPTERIEGCRFRTRCPLYQLLDEGRQQQCRAVDPHLQDVAGRGVACLQTDQEHLLTEHATAAV